HGRDLSCRGDLNHRAVCRSATPPKTMTAALGARHSHQIAVVPTWGDLARHPGTDRVHAIQQEQACRRHCEAECLADEWCSVRLPLWTGVKTIVKYPSEIRPPGHSPSPLLQNVLAGVMAVTRGASEAIGPSLMA